MNNYKRNVNIAGWLVFAIATLVYIFSVERTGSLWDCGEFVSAAYKLQVVHPPGAPLFLLVGRLFTWVADIFSDNPSHIAFAVNLMSGVCTAFAATFVCWVTIMLGKLTVTDREGTPTQGETIALMGAGIVAGLGTAFATSIWFSAVEGEVYAMSTFFTALTLWAVVKWYVLPKGTPKEDQWLVFAIYAAALSTGVHLLSILTFPALALFYYYKKYEKHTWLGLGAAAGIGVGLIVFIQKIVIAGLPTLWSWYELIMVNSFGLPRQTGLIPLFLTLAAIFYFGLKYAADRKNGLLQKALIAVAMMIIGYSTIGVVVIRSNANPPINMNAPDDAMSLIPYINREQYGERPLLYGAHFDAKPLPTRLEDIEMRHSYVEESGKYEETHRKFSQRFDNRDKMFFPRMGHNTMGRPSIYRNEWMGGKKGDPTFFDNISFFVRYQLGWMYWRYFMWNFAGRQNGEQGFTKANVRDGNWLSGITPIDEMRLYDMDLEPTERKTNQARNTYYFLPFIFGLIGMFYHARKRRKDFIVMLAMFVITGIGLIIYSNQPPHEPRERDYVLVGSFFTYCFWMGMAVLALFQLLRERAASLASPLSAGIATALIAIAPVLMGVQNYDDHSRKDHTAARDYASNFLNSLEKDAIIFTYGDNDTYPLWYAQEVEGIRPDVRIVNLSLIAVDWYIHQLTRKVNESPPIKLTLDKASYRGYQRDFIPIAKDRGLKSIQEVLKYINEDHSAQTQGRAASLVPTNKIYIPVDKAKVLADGVVDPADSDKIVSQVEFTLKGNNMMKGDLAVMDIIGSNLWERPIYFAVTVREKSLLGLKDYTQLEGLALRIIPIKSKSEQRLALVGGGRMHVDKYYDNVMNKFRWGNFDKERLFIDRSYAPSIQSHQLGMIRCSQQLIAQGDNERAIKLADKYFEVFPSYNFPYDMQTLRILETYLQTDAYDKAKPYMKELADVTAERLKFLHALSPTKLKSGFQRDMSMSTATMQQLMRIVQQYKDTELEQEFQTMFGNYLTSEVKD